VLTKNCTRGQEVKEVEEVKEVKEVKEKSTPRAVILKSLRRAWRRRMAKEERVPLPCFLEICDSIGVRGLGSAKFVILKGLEDAEGGAEE